ncbi:MAG: 8-oxo-dGTP diphosphatase [Herpetosiphonaceae bacterium]|nr:8-oxo-dGTP diphosphatase [Herpetosiphonaceae bacterium]
MYQPILATLGYVLTPDREQVLVIHRNKRPDDIHYGKYNGLGGRLESNESVTGGMCREIWEESGISVDRLTLRGTISWPGFGKHGEDWFGFIFRIDQWHGDVHAGNHEGTLEWKPLAQLLQLPIWPSDRNFLPMVFDTDPRPFHGVMPYHQGAMVSWQYERL